MDKHISIFRNRYDTTTIMLHWVTALLVIFQFLSALVWDYFPRPDKHLLILSHMSLGFLLAAVLSVRILWRLSLGTKLSTAAASLFDNVANALHLVLYVLLAVQMPLGFVTRWTDNQPLNVFGLLIPSPIGTCSKVTGRLVDQIHDVNAWIIMSLVGIHAAAALIHHFLWRDDVLRRMIPNLRKP